MGWTAAITAGTSIIAARQASATAKYNQAIQNRNARVMIQRAEAIEQKKQLDKAQHQKSQLWSMKIITIITPPQKSVPEGRRPSRATALRSNASPLGRSPSGTDF